MAYLDWLDAAVRSAISNNAAGTLVALRALLQISSDHGHLLPMAAQTAELASRWFAAPLARVSAHGDLAAGHLSVLAEYAAGQTALLTAEVMRNEPPMVALLLFANRGTLEFRDAPFEPQFTPIDCAALALVERSLATAQPVEARDAR